MSSGIDRVPKGMVMTQYYFEPWYIAICQDSNGSLLSILTEEVESHELFRQ